MKEFASRIIASIDDNSKKISSESIFTIDKGNFRLISDVISNKTISFLDGGNMEILKAPTLSMFFNRIYLTSYSDNHRMKNETSEFYSLITSKAQQNKIMFSTEYHFLKNKMDLKEYSFDSFDKTITFGNSRAKISIIGDVLRRFAELTLARSARSNILILDGSLEQKYTYESELIAEAGNGKLLCGLSKTTDMLTDTGSSAVLAIAKNAPDGAWYYFASKEKNYDLYFAKLHEKSRYIFRVDVMNNERYDADELFSILKKNSKDAIFLGYPYGLVEADKFARVSKKERDMLQMQLQMILKKDYDKLIPLLSAANAHDILDTIS
ncbi:MAG: DNA double-strand break repair nuclease NurA [archaeon]